jgi:hypothetical protein
MARQPRPGSSPEEPDDEGNGDSDLPETGAWSFEADQLEDASGGAWNEPAPWEDTYQDAPAGYAPQWGEPAAEYTEYDYRSGQPVPYAPSRQEALAAYEDGYATAAQGQVWDEDAVNHRGLQLGRRVNGPWPELVMITAVAVVIAAVILAITTANRANLASPATPTALPVAAGLPGGSTKPKVTNSPSTVPPTSTTLPTTSTTAAAPTTLPPARQPAQALGVTTGVAASLVNSWLASNPGGADLGPRDVAGTVPGEVYYARQPFSGLYWAIAAFEPSATVVQEASTAAGEEKLGQFQDRDYVFSWKAGPVWTLLGYTGAGSCPSALVPKPVLAAWGLCGLRPAG